MYLTLLPGGKKLDEVYLKPVWDVPENPQSEQWNVTSWKIPCLAHQLAWMYLLLASNLPTRSTRTNASKMLLHELIAFSRVICFHSLPTIHSTLPESITATPATIHHAILKGHILETGSGTGALITHLLERQNRRIRPSPTCVRSWADPSLDGYRRPWAPWGGIVVAMSMVCRKGSSPGEGAPRHRGNKNAW